MLSFPITLPSCDNFLASEAEIPAVAAKIFEPSNDYYVDVVVMQVGLYGCTTATIIQNGNPVNGLNVQINQVELEEDEEPGFFTDVESQLDYTEKTKYVLKITKDSVPIATGLTYMPSKPEILSPKEGYHHPAGTNLEIDWQLVTFASAIRIGLESSDNFSYEIPLQPISPSKYTISGTVVSTPGEYYLSIYAYNGLAPGFDFDGGKPDSTIGYNIEGPAGMFVALNGGWVTFYVE